MSSKKHNERINKVSVIIAWILIVIFLLGVIAIIWKFTSGGTEDFKTFYLVHDGEDILTVECQTVYARDTVQRYDVKYTFDIATDEPRNYNVKIIPNKNADFDFTVDGFICSWSGDVDDLSEVFGLSKQDTYFTFSIAEDFTVKGVLEALYTGKKLDVPKETDLKNQYLYMLEVSSYNEKVIYHISFALFTGVGEVVVDQDSFVF